MLWCPHSWLSALLQGTGRERLPGAFSMPLCVSLGLDSDYPALLSSSGGYGSVHRPPPPAPCAVVCVFLPTTSHLWAEGPGSQLGGLAAFLFRLFAECLAFTASSVYVCLCLHAVYIGF